MRSVMLAYGLAGLLLALSLSAAADTLHSDDLWLRESVPGTENGAGFGTLTNKSDEDIVVVSASSAAAADVEIHEHAHVNGQMRMQKIDALTIPAGQSVTLRPGGYHLMLMQLKAPLQVDEQHIIALRLSTGEQVEFEVTVKPLLQ